ncbi:uncharacterized protein LOC117342210 [Pecten maximus]|uniref:uncharacterized protein LOC117342210 n=1 Tax=Pecten maximus TaxID=6579 RepID=UPI0014581578|nr:uncharacterized protein LOC117342210 [Pecten maximus]
MVCKVPCGTGADYQVREEKLKIPKYVGYTLIPVGIINIVIGIVTLVYLTSYKYPLPTGYQIWTGILAIVIGVFGVQLGSTSENMKQDVSPEFRKKFFAFFWSSNTVNWLATQGFGYAIASTVICEVSGCSDKNDLLVALHAITIALTLIICIGGWMGQYFFYKFRKTYGILSDKEIQQLSTSQMMQKS